MTDVEPTGLTGAGRRTFRSLRTRNFRLFFFGQLVSNTGNWLTNVALTLLVLHLSGSGIAVGALTAAQFGPILVLSAWAGAIADRSDKRKLLFVTQGLEMGQSITLAVFAFMPDPPLAGLYVTAVAGGVMLAFDNPLRRSFVTEMVPPEDRPNAVALYRPHLLRGQEARQGGPYRWRRAPRHRPDVAMDRRRTRNDLQLLTGGRRSPQTHL
jgi:hypothetical protein